MGHFNIEDYETVNDRITRFYKDHELGSIRTEIEKISDDFSTVIVKAYIIVGGEMKATGYAMEIKGQGFVNKTAWLENAETSAIGRALANFNYSGDLRPSREEMLNKTENIPAQKQEKQKGDYDKALNAITSAEEIGAVEILIKQIDDRSWQDGEREKLLLFAQKRIDDLKVFDNAVDKLGGMFGDTEGLGHENNK